jgi:filamentous hemagglutinin
VVVNNPYIGKGEGGKFTMTQYLPEVAKITEPGGSIVINGGRSNKYIELTPDVRKQIDDLGLNVVYQGKFEPTAVPWKDGVVPEFRSTGGKTLETNDMRTIILQKK